MAMNELLSNAKLLQPLRLQAFRTLWAGMTVSLLGDGVTLVAIAWQVYELSDVPTALGMTMMAMSIPQVLLLLFGGIVSDRFERRRVMIGADAVRGLALLAMGGLSIAGALELWHMSVIAAVYGAGNAFFGPAFDAMVPELVPDEYLAQANSLDHLVRPLAARLFGPALGGWTIAAVGVGWAFLIDAASFAVSIACLLHLGRLPRPEGVAEQSEEAAQEDASIWDEVREGFAFVRSKVWLWGSFLAATLAYLIFLGPAEVLLPHLVKNELGGGADDLGLVFAMGGLGAVTASLLMAQRGMPRRLMTFIYVAWSLSTLAVAGYGLAQLPWQVMLACFTFNFFETAGLIVWLTTKQLHVPDRLLGRVSSLDWLISIGLMPLSYALAGPVGAWLGTRETLVGAGIVGALVTLSFLFLPGMRAADKLFASGSPVQAS
jgi:DHA3 family tetracycline resistance protein-like MFS transporter